MIKGVMVVNAHGQARLVKIFEEGADLDEAALVRETFSLVAKRPESACNFFVARMPQWGPGAKIVYRHYATLFFLFVVDDQESELGILDLIQVFVETLDKCFENVCELDIIFHGDKVHYILDEIIMGGMVLETNVGDIVRAVNDMMKLEARKPEKTATPVAGGRRP